MSKPTDKVRRQRLQDLTRLARALYESANHEEDLARLERHRLVAVELAGLLNAAINEDDILDPDLGLELILFIEHKAEASRQTEAMRAGALAALENSERQAAASKL